MTRAEAGSLRRTMFNAFVLRGVARQRQEQADKALQQVLEAILIGQGEESEKLAQVFDAVAGMEPASKFSDPL